MRLSGAAIAIETLIAHGVTDVFGIPGGSVLNLYDELYSRSHRIRHHLTAHEQGATHAADGYARASGKAGVVIATSGPGATNLITGIATAYLDSSPIVAITGNVPTNLMGKDSFQEVDITGVAMPITKHGFLVKDINALEDTLCEAFRLACSGRPGPVLVDIPKDIQIAEADFKGGTPLPELERQKPDQAALEAAAELINASQRPYIYAGGGVVLSDSSTLLTQLAEKLDAPTGLSMMGLTAMSSTHPLNMGMTGMHGLAESSQLNAEADLIIGIGVRFSDRATGNIASYREKAKIIHIDVDNAEIDKNVLSDVSLLGDIRDVLPRLIDLVESRERNAWLAHAADIKVAMRETSRGAKVTADTETEPLINAQPSRQDDPLIPPTPYAVIQAVRQHAGDDTEVATDVGQHQMWVAQYYPFNQPRTLLTSGGLGTMGFGLGAAIGASIANGSRSRTLLFTGDGSFHMNLNELATAVRYQLPIVIIIMNNGVLGMVRQWQSLFYQGRYAETTLNRPTDYVKLAEAFGAVGYKVASISELHQALQLAFASNGPVLIDCPIDPDASVYPIIPPGGSYHDMIIA